MGVLWVTERIRVGNLRRWRVAIRQEWRAFCCELRQTFVNIIQSVKRHPAQWGAGLTCLVLVCVCSAFSVVQVSRSSSETETSLLNLASGTMSEQVAQSEVGQSDTLSGDTVVAQAMDAVLENSATATTEKVLADVFITSAGVQSLDASSEAPTSFSLVGSEASFNEDAYGNLVAALSAVEEQGYTVGCFLLNMNTGEGIAYNLDSRVYGASSFKGPYAVYLSEQLIDNGVNFSESSMSMLEAMVQYSDNDSFTTLRNQYDSLGFADWVASCGVDASIVNDTHYPRYSARESALLWLHAYDYLRSGTDQANHLSGLFTQTNVSFVRDGVNAVISDGALEITAEGDSSDESELRIMNKAGWNSSGTRFSGLCDAGLVQYGDATYLMSVMCSAPDSVLHRAQVSEVAAALFAAGVAL